MDDNKDDSKPQTSSTETNGNNNFPQIALGCEDGFIYILKNYEIFRYAHVKRTVTKLETVKLSKVMDTDVDNNDSEDSVDSLLCSGHFNALLLYYRGQVRIMVVGNLAYFSTVTVKKSHSRGIPSAGLVENRLHAQSSSPSVLRLSQP